ncbi:hypothetical protein GLGCALEP_00128 [Pseudomonas sp. MM221]|nr:hypothetical protein GLGCALEP_00128 [Pseudomonas sp. MM221]
MQHQPANAAGRQYTAGEQQPEHTVHPQRQARPRGNQNQLVIWRLGGHTVDQAVAEFEQRLVACRPGRGRRPHLWRPQHGDSPGTVIQHYYQATARGQIDHIGQVPARGGNHEIAPAQHQRSQVLVRFGGGVQPVAVGRPLDVGWPQGFERPLVATVGAGDVAIDISRFINEPRTQANLLQRRQHRRAAATQGLRLQQVYPFTQLAEHLLEAIEKTLALGVHLLALALLHLLQGNSDAGREQQGGAGQRCQCGQHPGTVKNLAQQGDDG